MTRHPKPVDPDKIVSTSFKVPEGLRTQLKVAAALERRDMSDLVADALVAYFAKTRSQVDK
jgi:hypothetical protein